MQELVLGRFREVSLEIGSNEQIVVVSVVVVVVVVYLWEGCVYL